MILLAYLHRCDFDARFERYLDQSLQIEPEDIETLKNDYSETVCRSFAVIDIKNDDPDADDKLDTITTDAYFVSKKESGVSESLNLLLRSYYGFLMSISLQDDYLMLDRFEEELFNQLDGYSQKNYIPLCFDNWDASDLDDIKGWNYSLKLRYEREIAKRMMIENPTIDLIDKLTILKNFRDIYEPDFDFVDFASRFYESTFRDLINHLNHWLQCFVYCNDDGSESLNDFHTSIIIDCVDW